MCVTICGRFCLDEGAVAGYGNRIQEKSPAKWGVQIAGMIFQTRSRTCRLWECFLNTRKEGRVCNMKKKQGANCEYCVNYSYDDDYECYTCDMNLDEDEMYRFITGTYHDCPYFRMGDEYRVVRKQM